MSERENITAASGKAGFASYVNEDFEKFESLVRSLPTQARDEGTEFAISWGRVTLRSWLALFSQGPDTPTRRGVAVFFKVGVMRLLCDGSPAGERFRDDFLSVVLNEYFLPSAKTVFEHATEREERYVPDTPARR